LSDAWLLVEGRLAEGCGSFLAEALALTNEGLLDAEAAGIGRLDCAVNQEHRGLGGRNEGRIA
jgi:hypothetical protein